MTILNKKLISLIILITTLFFYNVAFALDCDIPVTGEDAAAPNITQIVCPFARILNLMVLVVGVVFVIMGLYGAIKIATSWGDPKGLQLSQQTWTHAIAGLAIVLGFFAIILIILNILGITDYQSPGDAFEKIMEEIKKFFTETSGTGGPVITNP
ncbi:hypothetical protein A3A69_01025 [candidate division WWE3 bacterium RIFCSPLOWO2_01_FULL_37_15]|uniref:Uncharacterized protein n=1 Tax=candidate division WWE3 bacterium RIFCSPLOWO2_01_FULL_37_15 TaxID=1802622 RepID=A0A1F4UZD8_UNCKA|nr:MAG: hypothetical protein A3A69_01025 [candidate division WWE3 bacterium RIFCSPLOWO2_01_FULL_37_15]